MYHGFIPFSVEGSWPAARFPDTLLQAAAPGGGLRHKGNRLATPERMPQTTWRKRW